MRLHLEGAETAKAAARKLRRGSRRLETLGPAFRKVDTEIDKLVRTNFANESGGGLPWKHLSKHTEAERWRERGWYANPPTADAIGRWTQDMYGGLMGRGVNGQKIFTKTAYTRAYLGIESEGSIGKRVEWFHGGTKTQPKRPLWKPLERSKIARKWMRAHFKVAFES